MMDGELSVMSSRYCGGRDTYRRQGITSKMMGPGSGNRIKYTRCWCVDADSPILPLCQLRAVVRKPVGQKGTDTELDRCTWQSQGHGQEEGETEDGKQARSG